LKEAKAITIHHRAAIDILVY